VSTVADVTLPRGAFAAATRAICCGGDEHEQTESQLLARAALEAALPLIERAALKRAAQRIELLHALARGWVCPACHGKPASTPHLREGRTGYRCGCGHQWEPPSPRSVDYSMDTDRLIRRLARGEALPELPPKVMPSA
jgi:hypothetical protein